MNIDAWSKRIWLLIGCVILLTLLGFGIAFIISAFPHDAQNAGVIIGDKAKPSGPDSLVWQDLSYVGPHPLGRTELMYVGIEVKQLSVARRTMYFTQPQYEPTSQSISESRFTGANWLNVMFINRDGSGGRLLLNKKAFIIGADLPTPDDSLQFYGVYLIAFKDTDHNGKLTAADSSQLYISDLYGEKLTRITPDGQHVEWYRHSSDHRYLYIKVRQQPASVNDIALSDWHERMYVTDTKTRITSAFPNGNEIPGKLKYILEEE